MIDETYVEFAPDISEITAVTLTREFTNLMVLRWCIEILRCSRHAPRLRNHRKPRLSQKNERKTGPMVLKQPRSPRRRTHAPGQRLHPPHQRTHPLRTHPTAPGISGNSNLQNLSGLRQLYSPEDPEASSHLLRRLRRLHPTGAHDP